jgi:dipeptidyl aminopeptidase/acylaminoacyl peptidase
MRFILFAAAVLAVALPSTAAAATFTPDDEARIVGLSSPVFAPDGARIALVRTLQDTKADKSHTALITVDVATGALRVLTTKVEGIAQPAYSPDGKQLAFLSFDKNHQRQIQLMAAAGGVARAITKVKFGVQQFAWRPDGRAVAYITQDDPPARIAAHRDFIEITNDDYLNRSNDPPSHLWLVNADGTGARRLTSGTWSAATSYPPSPPASPLSWTPDGKSVAFARVPNTHDGDAYLSEIDVVDVGSGSLRPVRVVRRRVAGRPARRVPGQPRRRSEQRERIVPDRLGRRPRERHLRDARP